MSAKYRITKVCPHCKIKFETIKSKAHRKYCSRNCLDSARKVEVTCLSCGKIYSKRASVVKEHNFCCIKCYGEWQSTQTGELSRGWQGGVVLTDQNFRRSESMIKWRRAVFSRDNHTCRYCGIRGGKLNAHHIKRFRDFPELRLEVANGITLCVTCHTIETNKERRADIEAKKVALQEPIDESRT